MPRLSYFGLQGVLTAAALLASCVAVEAAAAPPVGYLFVTFKNGTKPSSEQIYFGLSKDGRKWTALNEGKPVLVNRIGNKGARDPFLLRSNDGAKFFLIATDLSMHHTKDWSLAKSEGGRSIVIWESRDLVHWSPARLAEVAPNDAGCVWAPEAIYDEEQQNYLLFWASTSRSDGFSKFRIWGARTTNFQNFSEPFIYIEKPTTIIDTTIVRDGGRYYRFTKDEKFKAITMEMAERLDGPWRDVREFSLSNLVGYEGPEAYMTGLGDSKKRGIWTLIIDQYSTGQGYRPFVSEDISSGKFVPGAGFSFPFEFRHGSVLALSAEEFDRVNAFYGSGHRETVPSP